MDTQAILTAISCIMGIGIVYGQLNTRLKQLEKDLTSHKDLAERLTRIEEKVFYIAENIKSR